MALLVGACSGSDATTVAANVDGTEITAAEVDEVYARRAEAPAIASELARTDSDVDPQLQASVLTTLIRTEVLRKAAEDRGVEVTDEQRAEQREQLAESAGGEEALQDVLAQSNVSEEELEANLTDQAIQAAISEQLGEDVTEDQVETAYEEDPQGLYGEKVEVRHILTETEDEADDAIERIESGEDFAEVAQDLSQDPGSAENGGELGEVAQGTTVPAFDEAAFDAEVGELVGPVETEFGFHVLEVTDQVPPADLDDVEGEIREQLQAQSQGQAFNEYITGFVAGLEIEVDPAYGTWDAQSVSVIPPTASEAPLAPEAGTELPVPSELPVEPTELPTAPPSE